MLESNLSLPLYMFWLSTERPILTKYGSYRGEMFIYLYSFFDALAAKRAILMQFASSVVKYNIKALDRLLGWI
jgi:hypothetical protein